MTNSIDCPECGVWFDEMTLLNLAPDGPITDSMLDSILQRRADAK
jgi:hypothetical protein